MSVLFAIKIDGGQTLGATGHMFWRHSSYSVSARAPPARFRRLDQVEVQLSDFSLKIFTFDDISNGLICALKILLVSQIGTHTFPY